jgi:hypothetical protein
LSPEIFDHPENLKAMPSQSDAIDARIRKTGVASVFGYGSRPSVCAAAKNRNIELKLFVNRKVSLSLRGLQMDTGGPRRNINNCISGV